MNTPWVLNEDEAELVACSLLETMKELSPASDEVAEITKLLAQYCGPRNLSIDYKEWKFVRFI